MKRLAIACLLALAACAGEDDTVVPDADPGAPDAAPACVLSPTTVSCTVGDDSPCTAVCAEAYCYNFMQLASPVCTSTCTTLDDCPSGWTCNGMGRCRPPG